MFIIRLKIKKTNRTHHIISIRQFLRSICIYFLIYFNIVLFLARVFYHTITKDRHDQCWKSVFFSCTVHLHQFPGYFVVYMDASLVFVSVIENVFVFFNFFFVKDPIACYPSGEEKEEDEE